MTTPLMNLCLGCDHLNRTEDGVTIPPSCTAFPDRIPSRIYVSGQDHRKPTKGDHGITFKENPGIPGYEKRYDRFRKEIASLD